MVIIRILQPFLCFSFIRIYLFIFFNLLNFYPVTRFLVTPLLVTALLCLVKTDALTSDDTKSFC